MKELTEYTKQVVTFETIKLEAHKFGTLITFSQEAIEDTGYNVKSELMRQLAESYGLTLDELIVKENEEYKINGLNGFSVDDRLITAITEASKSYVCNYTGQSIDQLEEHEDVTIAVLVLIAEFYDNGTINVNDRLNLRVNMMLESLL